MVTDRARAKSRRNLVPSRRPQPKLAKGSKTRQRARKDTRRRTVVSRPKGKKFHRRVPARKKQQDRTDSDTCKDEVAKPARKVIRRSPRHKSPSEGRRSGVRRSTRPTKQTSRYQASNKFDVSRNRGDQRRVDDLRKNQLISHNKDGKKKTAVPVHRDLSDTEDDNDDDVDSGLGTTADEDSNCSMNQNLDARLGQASSTYQGPSSGHSCCVSPGLINTAVSFISNPDFCLFIFVILFRFPERKLPAQPIRNKQASLQTLKVATQSILIVHILTALPNP